MKKPITLVLREPSKPVYTKKQVRKLVHDAFKAGLINTYQNDSDAQLLRTMSTFQEPSGKVARAISTALKTRFRQEGFAIRLFQNRKLRAPPGDTQLSCCVRCSERGLTSSVQGLVGPVGACGSVQNFSHFS
jgi:hypothetical protein